jgi:gamma-glutamyl-gamma-aminobutyrate hydrolase PuuD
MLLSRLAKLKDVGHWLWGYPPTDSPRIVMSLDRSLVSLLGISLYTYGRLIRQAGGRPLKVSYGVKLKHEELETMTTNLLHDAHGLLLTGGEDVNMAIFNDNVGLNPLQIYPRRDHFEIALLKTALAKQMPILGICRGCQLINVAHGGTLRNLRNNKALQRYHRRLRPHEVYVDENAKLANTLNATYLKWVRSTHGMAVNEVGRGFQPVAWARDGVTEAIEYEDKKHWIVGLQWHPELMFFQPVDRPIIYDFIEQARQFAQKH